jgi:CubicO group peptidase (beta-lactamase class C family)
VTLAASQPAAVTDETSRTVDEFKAAAATILRETGVPGAGISIVRADGVEWEGGLGYADRDARTPVTPDTHFHVGSISKTFVALALVQLAEDGVVDPDAPVNEIAPEIAIDNRWHATDPVRIVHLLQHTAGFDDMHFNERYMPNGEADRPLAEVLAINPRSRRVRWLYLRPAGNLQSSARELGRFVRMLLAWGELDNAFVVDPEYLGSMEQPRTSDASKAGLRNGYGSGIAALLYLPFFMLGHGGEIDGFLSSYAYSPSRDVGYVILLNSTGDGSSEAMRRLSSLAVRFLKRDVEPPVAPRTDVDGPTLSEYAGYYHDANPRNQIAWPVQSLLAGQTIVADDGELAAVSLFGTRQRLIPVANASFRLEHEIDASRVFTRNDEDAMVPAGGVVNMVRRPRWHIELVRLPVWAALGTVATVAIAGIIWLARIGRARPRGFWMLKLAVLACLLPFAVAAAVFAWTPHQTLGTRTLGTSALCLATFAVPALSAVVTLLGLDARRQQASVSLVDYAYVVALAMAGLALYLGSNDLLGLRLWNS